MLSFSNSYSIPFRTDLTNHGGGFLAYLNSSLLHTGRPDLAIFCNESIWVEVKAKIEMLLIGIFYSPTTADSQFFKSLNLNIEKAFEISKNLILVGDLNEDLLIPNYHNLKDLILDNSMKNVITESTRQHSILDPIHEDFPFLDSGTIGVPDHISTTKQHVFIYHFTI